MILNETEKQIILRELPISITELSYENIAHKKVHDADIIIAIPEGKKGLMWFTTYEQHDVCFFLDIDNNNTIKNIEIIQTCFHFKLAFGTLMQGILFNYKKTKCFTVDEIYFYKGKNVSNNKYDEKLVLINNILTNDISQMVTHLNYTIFGFPLISNNFQKILCDIEQLPYKIQNIKFKYFTSKKTLYMKYYKPGTNGMNTINNIINNNFIFKVSPDIQNDIYNLLVYNNGKEEFYDTAFIPDYKTSVMMNKLFRNIKENRNLDALEESDNEDEFENENIDKYVYLDKSYKMICEYNSKFNKWIPIKVVDNKNEKIVTLYTLKNNIQENNYKQNNYYKQENNYKQDKYYNQEKTNNYYNQKNKYNINSSNQTYRKNITNIYNVSNKSR
jgi:hypothetical protein